MNRKYYCMVGKKYNRLTVEKVNYILVDGKYVGWCWCRCDCGKEYEGRASAIYSGTRKSCGCYQMERIKEPENTKIRDSEFIESIKRVQRGEISVSDLSKEMGLSRQRIYLRAKKLGMEIRKSEVERWW